MSESIKYCESLTQYQRLKTRVVHIGDVPLGGEYPIRVQSMPTTDSWIPRLPLNSPSE